MKNEKFEVLEVEWAYFIPGLFTHVLVDEEGNVVGEAEGPINQDATQTKG